MKILLIKIFISSLFVFFESKVLIGQESKLPEFNIYLKCTGKLNKTKIDTLRISYNQYYPFNEFIGKKIILHQQSLGKPITVNINTVNIFFQGTRILLEPEDTLYFTVSSTGEIILDKEKAIYHLFESHKRELLGEEYKNILKLISDTSRTSTEIIQSITNYFEKEGRLIESVFGQNKPITKTYLLQKSFYDFFNNYCNVFKKRDFTNSDSVFLLSQTKAIEYINRPSVVFDHSYRNAIFKYSELISGQLKTELSPSKLSIIYYESKNIFSSQSYKNFLLKLLEITSLISNSSYDYLVNEIYNEIKRMKFSEFEQKKVDKIYRKALVVSKNLKHIGELELQQPGGNIKKLKDIVIPGKVYLLDFWASWCLPCIEEFPFIKKITENYSQLQVISISIDDDKAKWLKSLGKHNKDVKSEYLIKDGNKNKLLKSYDIKDVPRFILFDSNGKCISSQSPRPSEKGFYDLITPYIKNIGSK